jgi:hypothetical protein
MLKPIGAAIRPELVKEFLGFGVIAMFFYWVLD